MKALVTGAAGFIGSRLCGRLLADGYDVVGVDALTDYYDRRLKSGNLGPLLPEGRFRFEEQDLATEPVTPLLDGVEVVFHQAAQPGVRRSWGEFSTYTRDNVLATQQVLAAAADCSTLTRLVYASSSSIYGDAAQLPTTEQTLPAPRSPYGVTKLAAEHLAAVYAKNFDVPTVSLRYFTVYGPGQRPDMAIHRMVRAAILQEPFPMYGDGSYVRDFTFVDDIVAANIAVATKAELPSGAVFNVAGGGATSVSDLLHIVGQAVGKPVPVDALPVQAGDVVETSGDTARLRAATGWQPTVGLVQGIAEQAAWQRALLANPPKSPYQ